MKSFGCWCIEGDLRSFGCWFHEWVELMIDEKSLELKRNGVNGRV